MIKHITGEVPTNSNAMLQIPLVNIFRLMEMYRYDAYYDGTYDNWHIQIVLALDLARYITFGETIQKLECVDFIENALYKLANNITLDISERLTLNIFLNTLKNLI
jgi:hypothetical protein